MLINMDKILTQFLKEATSSIPTISDHFLAEGIVFLNDDFDGNCLTKEFYESKMSFIEENFNRAINLTIPEDYIYLNYIK